MKKESKTKYVILIAFVVLALGFLAYEKLDVDLKDVDLFKKDVNNYNPDYQSDNISTGIRESISEVAGEITLLVISVFLALGSILISTKILSRDKGI